MSIHTVFLMWEESDTFTPRPGDASLTCVEIAYGVRRVLLCMRISVSVKIMFLRRRRHVGNVCR